MPRDSGGGCTRGLQVHYKAKPSMARTRDLKTGCEALESPDATSETLDSQTEGAKFDCSWHFNAFHRLIEPFRPERPLSSLSPTMNLPLASPPSPIPGL